MLSSVARLSVVTLLLSKGFVTPSLGTAPTAGFGGPEIILFHGGVLGRTVPITTWHENQLLLVNGRREHISADTKFHLGVRPRIELALFWGNWWGDVARDAARLAALTPAMASQVGAFYPAVGSEPALIAVGGILGTLSDSGLAVLNRQGIPTSLEVSRRTH